MSPFFKNFINWNQPLEGEGFYTTDVSNLCELFSQLAICPSAFRLCELIPWRARCSLGYRQFALQWCRMNCKFVRLPKADPLVWVGLWFMARYGWLISVCELIPYRAKCPLGYRQFALQDLSQVIWTTCNRVQSKYWCVQVQNEPYRYNNVVYRSGCKPDLLCWIIRIQRHPTAPDNVCWGGFMPLFPCGS